MKHGTGAALLAVVSVVAAVLVAACTSDRADSAAPPDRYRETGVSSGTGEPGASDASAPAPDGPATPPPTAPSGCGLTTKKGLESRSLNVDGKPRTYLKVVPTAYDPNTKAPLVLAFHTLGDTAAQGRAMFDLEASGPKAIHVYPSALPSAAFDDAARWDLAKGSDDFRFVDALIDDLSATLCIDHDRIFTTGFSNGGRMATLVGCYRGDIVRAIAPVAPGGNNAPLPATGCIGEVAVWEMLGDSDAAHEEPGILIRDYFLAANGCTAAATKANACVAYPGCKEGLGVTFCRHPGGHVWPASTGDAVSKFFAGF